MLEVAASARLRVKKGVNHVIEMLRQLTRNRSWRSVLVAACVTAHRFLDRVESFFGDVDSPRQASCGEPLRSSLVVGKSDDVAPLLPSCATFSVRLALELDVLSARDQWRQVQDVMHDPAVVGQGFTQQKDHDHPIAFQVLDGLFFSTVQINTHLRIESSLEFANISSFQRRDSCWCKWNVTRVRIGERDQYQYSCKQR